MFFSTPWQTGGRHAGNIPPKRSSTEPTAFFRPFYPGPFSAVLPRPCFPSASQRTGSGCENAIVAGRSADPARHGKRTVITREVVNALMYLLSTRCQRRAVPKDLPPKSYGNFDLWNYDGTLERIHDALAGSFITPRASFGSEDLWKPATGYCRFGSAASKPVNYDCLVFKDSRPGGQKKFAICCKQCSEVCRLGLCLCLRSETKKSSSAGPWMGHPCLAGFPGVTGSD